MTATATDRERIPYTPEWSEVEDVVLHACRKNFWRVRGWLEFEDLYSEAALIYVTMRARYVTYRRRHFLSLLRSSIRRKIVDLIIRRQRKEKVQLSQAENREGDVGAAYCTATMAGDPASVEMWDELRARFDTPSLRWFLDELEAGRPQSARATRNLQKLILTATA